MRESASECNEGLELSPDLLMAFLLPQNLRQVVGTDIKVMNPEPPCPRRWAHDPFQLRGKIGTHRTSSGTVCRFQTTSTSLGNGGL